MVQVLCKLLLVDVLVTLRRVNIYGYHFRAALAVRGCTCAIRTYVRTLHV